MAFYEVNSLSQAVKKYLAITSVGIAIGLYIGYEAFHTSEKTPQQVTISIDSLLEE